MLGASVHQVTEITYINLNTYLAYLAYSISYRSSISNLNIYRSPMIPL